MKVLFLDFDGVLNSKAHFSRRKAALMAKPVEERLRLEDQDLAPENLAELAFIMATVPDLNVVVSSTWRLGRSIGDLCRMLIQGGVHPRRMLGVTPRFGGKDRGVEIQAWMDENGPLCAPYTIAILDDDSDMAHLMPHLIKTSAEDGLTRADALRVIQKMDEASN